MLPSLRVGKTALYRGIAVEVLELDGENSVIRVAKGIAPTVVKESELLPVVDAATLLRDNQLEHLTDEAWDKAEARAQAVRAYLAFGGEKKPFAGKLAKKINLKYRQFMRIVRAYEQHESVMALMPAARGRKPGTHALSAEVERVVDETVQEYWYQPERPTVSALMRRIETVCLQQELSPPSRKTVERRLAASQERALQAKRDGGKRARYQFEAMPGHATATAPLERVEIDHTLADTMVCSDDPQCDYVARPWITIAIDVFTRCVLGIYISFDAPSALSNALCMTHVVLPKDLEARFGVPLEWPMHGLPQTVVTDNGKDFQSKAFVRGCVEHNIEPRYRPVGSPHYGGTIERLIGTLVGRCHLLPGTTKRNVVARGDYDSAGKAAMTLSKFRMWFVEQILGDYHLIEHRKLRIPPAVAWARAMEVSHAR